MHTDRSRLEYLFTSTRGLSLLAIAVIGLIAAIWGTLSGPMAEWGVRDLTVRLLGMDLQAVQREGRLVMLYHSIAFTVIALMVYLITGSFRLPRRASINATVTAGYLTAAVGGLGFGYFGHNWFMHGLYLMGMTLLVWAGILLAVDLWPFGKQDRITDQGRAHCHGGLDQERFAFFVLAVITLGSALVGAVPGMYFGNGFTTFLAENTIREPHKSLLQEAVVGHLHIMLALIGMGTSLLIGRWLGQRGWSHKAGMPLMVMGIVITALGAWSVILTPYAHYIIYVGSTFGMTSALFLVIWGFGNLPRQRLEAQGIAKPTVRQWVAALLHDPLKFGPLWQMIFFNFTVSGVGIFMAVRLEEIFRVWPHREERIVLTGHWHTLAALIATILLMYFADIAGLSGRIRQWFGWALILFSDLAFGAVLIFEMKRLAVSEYMQQSVVNVTMLLTDIGLGVVLALLGGFLVWRLFKRGLLGWLAGVLSLLLLLSGCGAAPAASPGLAQYSAAGKDPEAWVRIPAGTFPYGQKGVPTRIGQDFEMMVTEVTNAQYARYLEQARAAGTIRIMEESVVGPYKGDAFHGGRHEERIDPGDYLHLPLQDPASRIALQGERFVVKPGYEQHPVTMVSWFGALAYCEAIGGRLPTEEEWEYAARGPDGLPYPTGERLEKGNANTYHSGDPFEGTDGYSDTTPVGFYNGTRYGNFQTTDSPSPFGLYDMAGNAGEWTGSIYEGQHYRYIRGGSKAQYEIDSRVWYRNSATPVHVSPSVGFRCVRDVR